MLYQSLKYTQAHKLELVLHNANERKGREPGCNQNCHNVDEALRSLFSFYKKSPKNTSNLKEFLKKYRLTGKQV